MPSTYTLLSNGRNFRPLLLTQALSAFNHNQLRSSLLTLVAFRGLTAFGLASETVVALSTILIVAPYFLLSLPAGRIADRWPKSNIIRTIKLFEILIFLFAAAGLLLLNVPLLLFTIALAGMEAALFGPAKFGIVPEILRPAQLIGANAWLSATSIASILGGMISGNLLILLPGGVYIVAAVGVLVAVAGWIASLFIPPSSAQASELDFSAGAVIGDFRSCLVRLRGVPGIIAPVLGSNWFWYQGAINTTLFPLYVEKSESQPEGVVALLLIASSLGAAFGALCGRFLTGQGRHSAVPLVVLVAIVGPGLDMWVAGLLTDALGVARAMTDLFILSAGTGFYAVPLNAAIQKLTPQIERARLIGISHTLSGLAMILSGVTILLLRGAGLSILDILLCTALLTALIAAGTLARTLPRLREVNA